MHARHLFCNRTLNLRSVRAVGYDMDYTLIHYNVEAWETRAYEHIQSGLLARGWPVKDLRFDPQMVIRGLIIDLERGNLIKANRFGFVRKVRHGTKTLDFDAQREAYSRTIIDLSEPRWVFLNTLFSLSEGCIYSQLVDLLDAGALPGGIGYEELYRVVRKATDAVHMEGQLKAGVIAAPERYVEASPETALTLLDQKHAGKKLLLITNSEWSYTAPMMSFAFDRHLPAGMTWRELFDVIIVGARKPDFFTTDSQFFRIVNDEGLMTPSAGTLERGVVYFGGSARAVERSLGLSGDEILYVGDHMFGDVHVTKNVLRWRTALILRELEAEIEAIEAFAASESKLEVKMKEKEKLETEANELRLLIQRKRASYGPPIADDEKTLSARLTTVRQKLEALDVEIGPMARAASELSNPIWGLLTRAGNDKSHLARQLERYADVYTSRVSNFIHATPFVYLRSPRGSLPHDPSASGGTPIAPSGESSP